MKKSILFVDDDSREVVRFREVMGTRFGIGAGITLEDALAELRNRGVTKPDLVLLDLYYGPGN
jgi:PleD family two-component response regulator